MKPLLFVFVTYCLIIQSCATIPREAVQLSEELTSMIRSAEASHLALIDEYIAGRREQVNEFFEKTWIPTFMGFVLTRQRVVSDIEAANDLQKKQAVFKELLADASTEIKNQRDTFMTAIDRVDNELRNAVSAHYAQMLAVSQALTAHLASAAKVTETREELMAALKVDMKKILPLDKINNILDKALEYGKKGEEILGYADEVKSLLKER
jgi:putative heme iron utilization protein